LNVRRIHQGRFLWVDAAYTYRWVQDQLIG
jgi:hypothetical protein